MRQVEEHPGPHQRPTDSMGMRSSTPRFADALIDSPTLRWHRRAKAFKPAACPMSAPTGVWLRSSPQTPWAIHG